MSGVKDLSAVEVILFFIHSTHWFLPYYREIPRIVMNLVEVDKVVSPDTEAEKTAASTAAAKRMMGGGAMRPTLSSPESPQLNTSPGKQV